MAEVVNTVLSYDYQRGEYPTNFAEVPAIKTKIDAGYTLESMQVVSLTPIGTNNFVSVTATLAPPAP